MVEPRPHIEITIDGHTIKLVRSHAEHIVDTLIGNTLHGSDGWRDTAAATAREGMRHPDSSHGYTGHADASIDAYQIADAHDQLANAIRLACSAMAAPGTMRLIVGRADFFIDSNVIEHIVDTLVGSRADGALGWEDTAAYQGREYVRIKARASSDLNADNALLMRRSAEQIAQLHRDLAQALSHASNDGRHPYCEASACDTANRYAPFVPPKRHENVRAIRLIDRKADPSND